MEFIIVATFVLLADDCASYYTFPLRFRQQVVAKVNSMSLGVV